MSATTTPTASASLWVLGIEAQELSAAINRLAEDLEDPDPDVQQRSIVALEAMLEADAQHKEVLNRKADAYCYVVCHHRAIADFRKSQAHRLNELARVAERKADQMEKALIEVLTRLQPDATSFSLPQHELKSRTNTRVEITDASALPPELLRTVTSSAPDKDAIKKRLKAGDDVDGAALVQSRSWRIT